MLSGLFFCTKSIAVEEFLIEVDHFSGPFEEVWELCLKGFGGFEEMLQYDGKEFELIFVGILPEVALFPDCVHLFGVLEDFEHLAELVVEDYGAHLVAPEGVPMQDVGKLVKCEVGIVLLAVVCVEQVFPREDYGPEWPVVLAFMVGLGVGRIIYMGMDDDFLESIDQVLAHPEGEHDIIARQEGLHLGFDIDLYAYELVFA